MDAVKFLEEAKRMCQSYEECEACPADARGNFVDCRVDIMQDIDASDAVVIVEKWSMEHPRKTRQSVFLEQWPEAELDTNGAVAICPTILSSDYRSANKRCKHPGTACSDCRREFWMQEVE